MAPAPSPLKRNDRRPCETRGAARLLMKRLGAGTSVLLLSAALLSAAAAFGPAPEGASRAARRAAPAAVTQTVTNTNDSGAGSLRQAIADAPPGDTITFSLPPGSTITLTSAELVINKSLTITGPGAASLAVSGDGKFRVFRVTPGVTVAISGLTVRMGAHTPTPTPSPAVQGMGGGILNAGTLTLNDCAVTDNVAAPTNFQPADGLGGGIDNSGALTLTNCTVSNNRAAGSFGTVGASGFGGGINNRAGATLTVTNSTFTNNTAASGPGGLGPSGSASGGAIHNSGTMTLTGSTFSGNTAVGQRSGQEMGGRAHGGSVNNSATATATACKFIDNKAQGGTGDTGGFAEGGGVTNRQSATLTLDGCTLSGNLAVGGSGRGSAGSASGGGVANRGVVMLKNSTVGDNIARGSSGTTSSSWGYGGGVFNAGTATLTNSTISGNAAEAGAHFFVNFAGTASGGGVLTEGGLTLTNCTVTRNEAAGGRGEKSNAEGGGVRVRNSGTARPLNTIIAGNSVRGNSTVGPANNALRGPDVSGTFASQGHNLVGRNDDAESSFPAGTPNAFSDIVGTGASPLNALLGPLAFNGGPTRTHRPLPGSPAVEGGDNAVLSPPFGLTTDQRGAGFPRLFNSKVDVGAVEVRDSAVTLALAGAATVGEGAGGFDVTVTRAGGLDAGDVSVDFSATDGTASSRSDFSAVYGTLHFATGETSKTFTVFVTDDVFAEGDETVTLSLLNPKGGAALGTSASTLTITDDDASPAASNPVDGAPFFVRQHYVDFLGRAPDAPGLQFWTGEIDGCGADAVCREVKRVNVSAAFFLSIEFKETGFFALRVRRAAFGARSASAATRVPLAAFLRDMRGLGEGVVVGPADWAQLLERNRLAYLSRMVESPEFAARFPEALTPAEFVDALFLSAGVVPAAAEQLAALDAYGWGGTRGRAAALRSVAESASVTGAEFNPAFVLSEYFGYLRRNPTDPPDADDSGYQFWLSKLNQFGGNYVAAEMVNAFISSAEYRRRFGPQ